jgi:hypothetical protein
LWAILSFFDREPVLARACVVQSLRGGPEILAAREALLARLTAIVDEGRATSKNAALLSPLTAEGLVGAAFSILYTRLLRGGAEPLRGLLGELMGLIVLPYLGPAASGREQVRPLPEAFAGGEERASGVERLVGDPLAGISMRLTYRTVCVLEGIERNPGLSNRAAGTAAGVSDQGQISKLLARLERLGLLENRGTAAKGDPNAWHLTPAGYQVARVVDIGTSNQGSPASWHGEELERNEREE